MDNISIKSIFAKNLYQLRVSKGISQTELAKALNIPNSSTVVNWENGTYIPDPERICLIASILGVTPNHLLLQNAADSITYTEEENTLIADYRRCDEKTKETIKNILQITTGSESSSIPTEKLNVQKAWLKPTDSDYQSMKQNIALLIEARKEARINNKDKNKQYVSVSHLEIAKFLWSLGYDGYVSELDIKLMFFNNPKKIPSAQLFACIYAYLTAGFRTETTVRLYKTTSEIICDLGEAFIK